MSGAFKKYAEKTDIGPYERERFRKQNRKMNENFKKAHKRFASRHGNDH
jgi:hypothetical protein